jgi:AcrR family transcriptional regulator
MEYGYRAISTRQIADACGLTQPALYHHFADKQQLYAAMAREELSKTGAALERIVTRGESLDERLQQAARYLLSNTRHDHGQMLHDIRHELDAETRITLSQAFQAEFVQPLTSLFSAGQRDELLRSPERGGVEPVIATYLFLSMISQFAQNRQGETHTVLERQAISAPDAATIIVKTLLYGLAR